MATVKISELGGLAKGTATDNDVVPIVNGGTTKKMTLSNLRGKLRGASNTGGSCAALVGGINNNSAGGCSAVVAGFRNTNTNGGEWIGGGQDNTVDDKTIARSLGMNNYDTPELNGSIGSYSTILGGARNCINIVTASVYSNDYSIAPNVIVSGIDNVIESTATSTANAYWPYVGQNFIGAGVSNVISASSNSGNYPLGANTILNGTLNCVQSGAGTDSSSYMYYNTVLGGICNTVEGYGMGQNMLHGSSNCMSGSYGTNTQNNVIFGASNFTSATNESRQYANSIIGTFLSGITSERAQAFYNGIFGGQQHNIRTTMAGPGEAKNSVIIGGSNNTINDLEYAVVLGGFGQTATVESGTHVQQLIIRSTTIPTSDPGVLGQVWVDTTAGNTLKISL